jgi:polar amino acid transport system substrate-binding protein
MPFSQPTRLIASGLLILGLTMGAAHAQDLPAPGTSPRIDAIKKAGQLRVGVLSNPPWLIEDTTGSGEAWAGPAWTLSKEYAKRLGVKLVAVPVSHETKVPVLASNQVDLTISPLSVTKERQNVVDFITYSRTSLCVFGRADNPKVANAKSVDDFNSPDITIAYFTGGGEENWVKQRFPKAVLRGVSSAGTAAPVEEIMARRSDVTPINRIPWIALNKKVKGLMALPQGNNCQDSKEAANEIGLALDKNQPEFLKWLKSVSEPMLPALQKEEERIVETM